MRVHARALAGSLKPKSSETRDGSSGRVEVARTGPLLFPGYKVLGTCETLALRHDTHPGRNACEGVVIGPDCDQGDLASEGTTRAWGLQVLPSRPAPAHAGPGLSGIHLCCVSNSLVPSLLSWEHSVVCSSFANTLGTGDDARSRVEVARTWPLLFPNSSILSDR